MDHSEEEISEDNSLDPRNAVPHEWGSAHQYSSQGHPHLGNSIVQIIVPELPCIQEQGHHSSDLSIHVPSSEELVISSSQTSIAATRENVIHSSLAGKDSLSALAAAAEMDQVRHNQVLGGGGVMDGMKFDRDAPFKARHAGVNSQVVEPKDASGASPPTGFLSSFGAGMEGKLSSGMHTILPLAPFLHPEDHDALFYNEIYHFLSSGTFSDGCSEVNKRFIKKRASNYMLNENGTLSYGQKMPRQVITDLSEQRQILQSSHVDKDSGVHYGVRKMYNMIFSKVYWRTLYVDIGTYVRKCQACADQVPASKQGGTVGTPLGSLDLNRGLTSDRIMRVWKKVHVQIHGPYPKTIYENEYIISMTDPFSKWVLAQASPKFALVNRCANFIFDSFCTFGFAQCQVIGMNRERYEEMQAAYREKFDNAQDIIRSLVPLDSENVQQVFNFSLQEEPEESVGTAEMFEDLCTSNPNGWDEDLSRLLFHHSTEISPEGGGLNSPFSMMFARNPTGYISEQEKENISILEQEKALEVTSNRRKLRSSTLLCRHCHEAFTSKISFRIHQRKHTEEARRRGTLEGEERLVIERRPLARITRKRKPFCKGPRKLLAASNSEWSNKNSDDIPLGIRQQLTQSTVEAVKNILIATKEERSKRGKYHKYSPELRDEIAQYAIDHSIPTATNYWSERLGTPVSESSIRNFIRNFRKFSLSRKKEIGKYALDNGVDKAVLHFKEKMGIDLRKGMVIKLKKLFAKKTYGSSNGNFSAYSKRNTLPGARQKRLFSFPMKQEIGRYAHAHGITAAVDHFSIKLQFEVKECTVRKFKRLYLEHVSNSASGENEVAPNENVPSESSLVADHQQPGQASMDVLQPSISVLSSPNVSGAGGSVSTPNNFVYHHPYSLNMTASGIQANAAVIPMNHNSLAFHQGSVLNQGVATQAYQQSPAGGPPTVLMNQAFPQVAPPPFHQGYVGGFTQAGTNGVSGPGAPLAITHTTVSPSSMAHTNSPLQLTMGGAHLSQLSSVSVAPAHQLGTPPNIQPSHSSTQPSHVPHPPLQLVASTFPQPIPGSLAFESGGPLVSATVSLSNEPLSLMKETSVESMAPPHGEENDGTNLQDASVSVPATVNGVATSIIHIPGVGLSHMEIPPSQQTHQQDPQQHHHQHHQQQQPFSHSAHPQSGGQQLQPQQQQSQESPFVEKAEHTDEEQDIDADDYSDPPTPKKRKGKSKYHSSSYTCSKRGNYVSYSPHLRAEIARYASENGNLAAISHFKEKLGIDIPESTVRGLKDKYLLKMMRGEKDIKSLGFAQRGRPMRLGKYDNIVQDCIKELMNGGEKISSFLVIATAKQVLMQYEPNLLEENGGQVKLNPTWAKSFLKRIGLHNTA